MSWHKEAVKIGPIIQINGKDCVWMGHELMSPGFNKIATIEAMFLTATRRTTFALLVYEYHDGYRYVKKKQVLPLAETLEDAQRMAVTIISLLED